MRKLFTFIFVSALLFSLAAPAYASDSNVTQLEPFNEYDYVELLQTSSPQELEEKGLSEQETTAIISNFESALLNRASLSDSELRAYGYNNSEISLFHALANGETLSSEELRALGSTCNGSITRHSCNTKTAEFSYTFTWNRCPLITLSDSAAMRWIAYSSDGGEIGVEQVSHSLTLEYHFQGNAASSGPAFAHYGSPTIEPNLDFNTINMQFPVYQTHLSSGTGIIFDCYARTGTIRVSIRVPNNVSKNSNHIFVGGLYGHTLVGVGSPSVSVSTGSIGISFTGNTSIDPIASRKATIYRATPVVDYWT